MFVDAIDRVDSFTRAMHSIVRLYGHDEIVPATATLFFVNEDAWAVTCKHVADLIVRADDIHLEYRKFEGERQGVQREKDAGLRIGKLEQKYGLKPGTVIRVKNIFVNCVDVYEKPDVYPHPTQDLALVHFPNYNRRLYQSHAVFLGDSSRARIGRSLCRLGYPFPEFTNFRYNPAAKDIEWTTEGTITSPRFPMDGIITRLQSENGMAIGIEMSTPGLRGQSGGPLFDTSGLIYGMQSATRHLHLGFDIEDREVMVNGRKSRVSNYPFLNVGQCVHVNVIKAFLREKNVKFYEG